MDYKLVAMDMDGTLLNSQKEISKGNTIAIERAKEKGINFVVVSGRSTHTLRNFELLRKLGTPAIAYNGAKIVELDTGNILYEQVIEPKDAEILLNLCVERGSTVCAWSNDIYYTDKIDERSLRYAKLSCMEPTIIEDYTALANQGVSKMIWYDTAEKVQENIAYLKTLNFKNVNFCTSDPRYLEIMHIESSKSKSLERLANIYGIKPCEIIAIGDGENDLSMLKFAGLSVAMENAPDFVKSQCDYVTASNDNDGVAKIIEKFCLK